ncbi:MAG: deoxyribodipyrimidine photolyase [Bacteroidetes bacterium GWF2_40_14]|nr:MAG: deoxyribodipyrimidine photolyase [Bacteroidetes bacterium GWF2_40_14]
MLKEKINIFWFRNDLRLEDNRGLYEALRSGLRVLSLFIFDTTILNQLPDRRDRRVDFIHQALLRLEMEISQLKGFCSGEGSILYIYDAPEAAFEFISSEFDVSSVFCNDDYEPYAVERDVKIALLLKNRGITFQCFKDQVIFSKDDILKPDGQPYTVYTPYSRQWLNKLNNEPVTHLKYWPSEEQTDNFVMSSDMQQLSELNRFEYGSLKLFKNLPALDEIGFIPSGNIFTKPCIINSIIAGYHNTRNDPANENGTTRLSVHIRFGTISIRGLVRSAIELNNTWLGELIWREFFKSVIYHFPYAADGPFKRRYSYISWRNDERELEKWCKGETGYPIVDAGMRELNQTGFMHNRVRMITASFLAKHLLINWQIGESYFAAKLLDYDLSANNGNWQWAAGCGCDAAPYFRIFNPELQTKKFDPDNIYIRKWVPEFDNPSEYPRPIVDHTTARLRAMAVYKAGITEL